MRADTADYRALFLSDTPLMDARAPIEFARGAFPHAANLPLMSDRERHEVGLCYTQQGPDAAIALGHRLVSGEVKASRLAAWAAFANAHPDGYLYCFRGGMRSQIVQTWLREEAGIAYPRVTGGYKAMRGFLLETIAKAAHPTAMVVLGGMTGTGKTDVLTGLAQGIDLEGHAHHRGSSFGKRVRAQPAQIDFENALAIDILRRQDAGHRVLVFEDEGQTVGGRSMPFDLYQAMQQCPLVWLEDTLEHRIERILRDYVVNLRAEFIAAYGASDGDARFAERLRQSLDKIAKRLGGERHKRLRAMLDEALDVQRDTGAVDAHRAWIARLLVEYYDPMYAYQRQLKRDRIVMSGDAGAVVAYLRRLGA
ncbi:tRNA 2-selenouridine(34) synthase MnmH [Cupriavidus plantarum]|uniref:tRNA 2-selenouridine synthase n=1 Tax=Cupriavidus plantarum TaxID=942865 RepID=A0A316EYY8_9BURK|nr:tRNA 2-selenouridine(34) synthase MnmH [Cupriavidus plantarum]NYH98874.1 tRNA 2-selenouridine synthase [Cupriavidus plantarum]PWK37456.1 tRNA 2-selenouridine synthase [Cupriavidus plantarum]REF01799.1 tRNA 2-selenouridine synthase [Cupriavidus plantarum]RLK45340.1 tRNA 2-selenouridine synthase [Cupriavidus plantarum]